VEEDPQGNAADGRSARSIGDWITAQVFGAELEDVVIDDRFVQMPPEPRCLGICTRRITGTRRGS
jgi:hypothetical protein